MIADHLALVVKSAYETFEILLLSYLKFKQNVVWFSQKIYMLTAIAKMFLLASLFSVCAEQTNAWNIYVKNNIGIRSRL